MMNLDNIQMMQKIDENNMLDHILSLPDQLEAAWESGQDKLLPEAAGLRQIMIAGMGGSAIGGDLLAAYVSSKCPLPIFVQRDYDLPSWANGPETLVIACSHSGNTEETLSVFDQAHQKDCRLVTISTGGKLTARANTISAPAWTF